MSDHAWNGEDQSKESEATAAQGELVGMHAEVRDLCDHGVVQLLEALAELLEQRLREVGAEPQHEIPAADVAQAMAELGSTERSDAEKLLDFATRFPDADVLLKPICDVADRLDHDPETQYASGMWHDVPTGNLSTFPLFVRG